MENEVNEFQGDKKMEIFEQIIEEMQSDEGIVREQNGGVVIQVKTQDLLEMEGVANADGCQQ